VVVTAGSDAEGGLGAAEAAAGRGVPSQQVRFQPPLQRRGMVRRSRLLARLAAVPADVPLIILSAAAGYGKTTALSQWAETVDKPVAWIALDPTDNDPAQLARHIVGALQRAAVLQDGDVNGLTTSDGGGRSGSPQHLLSMIRHLRRPALLVLDDLQEVQARGSLRLILALVDGPLPGLQIAAAARTQPSLGLGRLRAEGRCAEFGRDELAFTEDETRQVLVSAGQRAEPRTVRDVVRRTEGWPAGVYLAALVARQDPDDHGPLGGAAKIAGDDVYIADYFRDELLARESPDNVRFLLRTSVLGEMSGPLCDAVLEQTGSAVPLAEAERRNLFVVPLDRTGEWYRYHRLFGEMLLSELRRREPGEEFRLHKRAASWYEGAGQPEQAIRHALAGEHKVTAARLINSNAREYVAAGRRNTVHGWLRALDEDALLAYPPIAVTGGWLWALSGDPVQAQRCLRAARAATFSDPMPDDSHSLESASLLLSAVLAPLGVDRMLDDAEKVVRLEPAGAPWRPLALAVLGIAHVLTGNREQAVKEFAVAADFGHRDQRWAAALAHAELAFLALQDGDPSAEAHAPQSLALIDEAGLRHEVLGMLTYAVCAWTAARRGDHQAAREHVGAAQRLGADPSPVALPWFGAQVAVALGRVALELGDPVAARLRIDEARQYLSHLLTEGVLRVQVEDLSDRLARGGGRARLPSAMALTAAEVRVLQLLPTHLSLGEIADELHVSRNTVKTQVAGMYRKLQAGTRTAAVQRGRDLGLLEP
jgi:LuxR family transcriptional regulator, maltose regulon positive regulatory protein